MKSKLFFTFALMLPVLARAASDQPLTVAVFDFDSKEEGLRDAGPKVAALITANLSADPQIVTVERSDIEKVMGEQGLGLSGAINPESAAKVGELTGAKVLVTGRVFKLGEQTVLVAKIIGTETSRVYGEIEQGDSSHLPDLAAKLAMKIAKDVTSRADSLVAKVVPREEKIDQLIKSLPTGKRPAVRVHITEQHFGSPVIDPAAETEFGYILKKAGFVVVDNDSDQKPDIEIDGSAFSAYGMRKGNLVSCQSRIEIKVRHRLDGGIIAVDRQTSVAIDLSEQVAAKNALENAADTLAERIVPKLIEQ